VLVSYVRTASATLMTSLRNEPTSGSRMLHCSTWLMGTVCNGPGSAGLRRLPPFPPTGPGKSMWRAHLRDLCWT